MNKCPKCGHEWPDEARAKGGRNKWAGMTPEQKSAEMSRIRKKGVKNAKARKRQPLRHNTPRQESPDDTGSTRESKR